MTQDGFRRMALAFPGATEEAHMAHPDFRVRGRIFATLGYPDTSWGMVKLTPEQQQAFIDTTPSVFSPVKGGWGRAGATSVRLDAVTASQLRPALATAWRNVAPKDLATATKPPGNKPSPKAPTGRKARAPRRAEPR